MNSLLSELPFLESRAMLSRGPEYLYGGQIKALKAKKSAAPGEGGIPGNFKMPAEQTVWVGG
jgi:hypothetical protein